MQKIDMRKIFIDLGALDGDTIKQFFTWQQFGDPNEFEIYAFEPNPNMKKSMEDLVSQKKNIVYSEKAAWIDSGMIEFTVDKNDHAPFGSTVMKSKKNWGMGKIIQVPCFDFSKWLRQFENNFVIVKMDIEGAEFPILEKCIAEGTVSIMTHLWVEMHENKVRDFTTYDKEFLTERLKLLTNFKTWH